MTTKENKPILKDRLDLIEEIWRDREDNQKLPIILAKLSTIYGESCVVWKAAKGRGGEV